MAIADRPAPPTTSGSPAPTGPSHCPSPDSPTGAHNFYIESPHGETSQGECRYCHVRRAMANYQKVSFRDFGEDRRVRG
jgi:hypothetical protein